jgi:hypothetical protein
MHCALLMCCCSSECMLPRTFLCQKRVDPGERCNTVYVYYKEAGTASGSAMVTNSAEQASVQLLTCNHECNKCSHARMLWKPGLWDVQGP